MCSLDLSSQSEQGSPPFGASVTLRGCGRTETWKHQLTARRQHLLQKQQAAMWSANGEVPLSAQLGEGTDADLNWWYVPASRGSVIDPGTREHLENQNGCEGKTGTP